MRKVRINIPLHFMPKGGKLVSRIVLRFVIEVETKTPFRHWSIGVYSNDLYFRGEIIDDSGSSFFRSILRLTVRFLLASAVTSRAANEKRSVRALDTWPASRCFVEVKDAGRQKGAGNDGYASNTWENIPLHCVIWYNCGKQDSVGKSVTLPRGL